VGIILEHKLGCIYIMNPLGMCKCHLNLSHYPGIPLVSLIRPIIYLFIYLYYVVIIIIIQVVCTKYIIIILCILAFLLMGV
jgi:hypothetical protein